MGNYGSVQGDVVFGNVSLQDSVRLASDVFSSHDGNKFHTDDLLELAKVMAEEPFLPADGGDALYLVPTPRGWGFWFETMDGSSFGWLPGNLVTIDLVEDDPSKMIFDQMHWCGGASLPKWTPYALGLKIPLIRPVIGSSLSEVDDWDPTYFFNLWGQNPMQVLEEALDASNHRKPRSSEEKIEHQIVVSHFEQLKKFAA